MVLPAFLELEDDTGYIRLTGHRVGLAEVVRCYTDGASAEMIAVRFQTLSLAHVHKVIAYYLENESEVNAYVAADSAELKRQEAEAETDTRRRVPSLEELRRRLAQLQAATH